MGRDSAADRAKRGMAEARATERSEGVVWMPCRQRRHGTREVIERSESTVNPFHPRHIARVGRVSRRPT